MYKVRFYQNVNLIKIMYKLNLKITYIKFREYIYIYIKYVIYAQPQLFNI